MASAIASFLGWSFLPDFVTGHLQSFYYALTIRAGDARPQPGSSRFARDRYRTHLLVLVVYLCYTLYEAHWEVRRERDFYELLGVRTDVDDKTLQSRFRRLTLQHHPDKITSEEQRPAAEQYYILLKLARDTLLDPARRFAYDRFGQSVTNWRHCITIRDYLAMGLQATAPWYLGTGLVMVVMHYLGFLSWGAYWRYLAFASLAAFELHVVISPTYPAPVVSRLLRLAPASSLLGRHQQHIYLPFQLLQIAHKAIITLFIALSRLGPLLESQLPPSSLAPDASDDAALARLVKQVEQLVAINGTEAGRLLALDLAPFRADAAASTASLAEKEAQSADLQKHVRDWMVQNTVRNDREVRNAVQKVLQKRLQASGMVEEMAEHPTQ